MTTRVTPLRTAEFGLSLAELTEHLDIAGRGPPHPGNLPVELTRLLGREAEVAELAELLVGTRLLTLAGPGGAGKSRLALTVARQCEEGFDGGAWWLDLGAIEEGAIDLMLLGARAADNPMGDVISHLPAVSASLLVLDNCEHVVEASARLVSDLLAARPELTVIATTRRPLGVPGEQLWRVPGLGLPPPLRDYGLDPGPESDDAPAVRLFLERARAVAPSFALNDGNRRSVIQICWWLDGLPLALELAAARVAVLSATDIAGRLERDPSLLSRSTSIAPARQRTLEATLDWSYNLLSPAEQVLFRRLGAFAGSFSTRRGRSRLRRRTSRRGRDLRTARLADRPVAGAHRRARLPRALPAAADGVALRRRQVGRQWRGGDDPGCARCLHAEAGRVGRSVEWRRAGDVVRVAVARERQHPRRAWTAAARAPRRWRPPGWNAVAVLVPIRLLRRSATVARRGIRAGRGDGASDTGGGLGGLGDARVPAVRLRAGQSPTRVRARPILELGDRPGGAATLQRLGSIEREQGRYESARDFHERALAL